MTSHDPVTDRNGTSDLLVGGGATGELIRPHERTPVAPSVAAAPEVPREQRAQVLLADGNADVRGEITRLLADEYDVVAVSNGVAALAALRAQPFDLVLADVMMPELDGLGLLAAVRADEATRGLPVILLSARAGPEARRDGLERGADDYLVKPFSASDLLARVQHTLALARLRTQFVMAERRARRRAERLQTLSLALSAATTPAEVYATVLAQGLTGEQADEEPLKAQSAALFLLDGDTLILAGSHQTHPALSAQYQRFSLHAPLPATEAVRTRSAIWIRSQADFVRQYPHLEPHIRQLAGEAAASLPLVLDNRVLGVFNCTFAQQLAFDVDEQNFLGTLASLAAQALERTRLFTVLREREEHFRSFVELNPQVPWTADPQGFILDFNERWLTLTGLTREEALGPGWMEVPHPDDRAAMVAAWTEAVQSGEPYDIEHRIRLADGSYRWMRSRAFARRDEQGQIVRWYGTTEDIHDRKALEAEREQLLVQERAARAQAEEASRLKDEFLATVSHELRTPLTAFLGYAELLGRRQRDEAYVARTVEKMMRSGRAQAQLIEDLLDVSRIITGRMRLEVAPCDLVAVVQAAVDTVRPSLEAKQLHLQLSLDATSGPVMGDANRLQQVLWNLLTNAAKFTPEGGCIAVQLRASGGKAELTVRDSGQGITRAFLPYVFDRFRQENSSTQRSVGGLGLGLAIARHLVELHGGTIAAASDGEGSGATFTVQLPLSATAPLEPPLDAPEQGPMGNLGDKLAGRRIVVVDDQHDLLELIEENLALEGALVRTCATAQEALTLVQTWQPDVLVSDIAMPGHDGYWLIRAIRALPPEAGGATPALALTAYVRIQDRLQLLAAGFNQYVPKPLESDELLAVVAQLAQQRGGNEAW